MDGNWTPLHRNSLSVALAVRAAADRRVVDAALLDPKAGGPLGYLRASNRLRQFGTMLAGTAGPTDPATPVTVLLVESGLWTRFTWTLQGYTPQIHVPGPEADDVVAVTSEAVVAAMLDGRIKTSQALERGLLVFDGPEPEARRTAARMSFRPVSR